ncbi:hypothetical protein [Haladaptatus sp. NG-WS-4]
MSTTQKAQIDCIDIIGQCGEDPTREPHEKETSLHVEGDGTHFSVTSFKRVVFEKLLQRPEFEVKHLIVQDPDGQERTIDSLDEVKNSSLTIIGVVGLLPVGSVNIGTSRSSDSHADIVK